MHYVNLISLFYYRSLNLENYIVLDWSTNMKSSIAYTKLLIMTKFQDPHEIISVLSPSFSSLYFFSASFPKFLMFCLCSIILHQKLMSLHVTC